MQFYGSFVLCNGQLKGRTDMGEELGISERGGYQGSSSLVPQLRPYHSHPVTVQLTREQESDRSISGEKNGRKAFFHLEKKIGSNIYRLLFPCLTQVL